MQSKATNANSNRIYKGAQDCVERKDHAKRNGEVLVDAFNASRSMKVMGVNLRVHYENTMRCDKPSTNLVSRTEATP